MSHTRISRRGAAAVELALLLPVLAFLFVAIVDFGRVFYYSQTVENAARAGALYLSDDDAVATSPYATVTDAALADASNLNPQPTVASSSGTDASGNPYVRVTVTWTFHLLVNYPGIPGTVTLARTVQMRKVQ
jgi:Flp pilus assembly protein TadG